MTRLLTFAFLLALSACSSSRPAIEQESAVVTARPDTTLRRDAPPIHREGRATMPQSVTIYQRPDTTAPAISGLVAVTIDRSNGGQGTVTVQTRNGSQTFRNAAEGQALTVAADSTGRVDVAVRGDVEPTYAPVRELSWWEEAWQRVRYGVDGFVLGLFAAGAVLVVLLGAGYLVRRSA